MCHSRRLVCVVSVHSAAIVVIAATTTTRCHHCWHGHRRRSCHYIVGNRCHSRHHVRNRYWWQHLHCCRHCRVCISGQSGHDVCHCRRRHTLHGCYNCCMCIVANVAIGCEVVSCSPLPAASRDNEKTTYISSNEFGLKHTQS